MSACESAPPVVGVTTYLERARAGVWDTAASFLPASYFSAVTAVGGIAVLLPPQPVNRGIAERVLDGLSGLIITGGRDLDPARYGQSAHPETDRPATDRDDWELTLLAAALRRDLPVLGICRGAQVLNVALGGTLHQHVPDVVGHGGHRVGAARFATRNVRIAPGSRLAEMLGAACSVPCYHHQAIDRLGNGVVAVARDDDGLIEAIEVPDATFAVAVQWHPEENTDDRRLFAALIAAAARYATHTVAP